MAVDRIQVERTVRLGLSISIYNQIPPYCAAREGMTSFAQSVEYYVLYRRHLATCRSDDSQTEEDKVLAEICNDIMHICRLLAQCSLEADTTDFDAEVEMVEQRLPMLPTRVAV